MLLLLLLSVLAVVVVVLVAVVVVVVVVHGVTSGCSSKRYSLTIYNNIYTDMSAKLESPGAMTCNNDTEKRQMDALFERLRDA